MRLTSRDRPILLQNVNYRYLQDPMSIFRQYIAPFLIVVVFLIALLAVSSRIFLPGDMAAPAPVESYEAPSQAAQPDAPSQPDADS